MNTEDVPSKSTRRDGFFSMRRQAMFSMMSRRGLIVFAALTFLHAGLTIAGFMLYARTAMDTSHGGFASEWTTFGQDIKSVFLWPILLPVLRYRPLLLGGVRGLLWVLLNSSLWIAAGWWIYSRLRIWTARSSPPVRLGKK